MWTYGFGDGIRTAGLAYGEVQGAPSASAWALGEDKPGLGGHRGREIPILTTQASKQHPRRLPAHLCGSSVSAGSSDTTTQRPPQPPRSRLSPRCLETSQRCASPRAGRSAQSAPSALQHRACAHVPKSAGPGLVPSQHPSNPQKADPASGFPNTHCFLLPAHPAVRPLSAEIRRAVRHLPWLPHIGDANSVLEINFLINF